MPEILAPSIFTNYLAGRRAHYEEQQGAATAAMRERQMQMQEAEFQNQQQQQERQQQFNQLASRYLGPETVEMAGGYGGGQADPYAAGALAGIPGQSQPPPQGRPSFSQLVALDPQRAFQIQQAQAEQAAARQKQDAEKAKQIVMAAQYTIRSEAPAHLLRIGFPEFAEQLAAQGVDVDALDDDTVRGYAQRLIESYGPAAGITPEYTNPEAGEVGGEERFVQFDKATGRPRVVQGVNPRPQRALVDINTGEERQEAKVVGESFGKMYADLQSAGLSAPSRLAKLDRMESLMQGIDTGRLAPAMTQVASVAESLGIKVDPKLGAKQALQALSNEIALSLRNPSGGAGMPGALSDKDREFLASMTPGLSQTPEGNKFIIQTARKLAQREQEVAKLARDYRKKNGSLDEGFYDELADFSAGRSLFGKEAPPIVTEDGWVVRERR